MEKNYKINNYILDNHQMQLLQTDSNALVLAGAGAGKTLTILGKVYYLIEKNNIKPEEILLISFTNASVNDIKAKIKYDINIFTFHKLAMHILEKNKINYSLCTNNLLKYIIQEYLYNCPINYQKKIVKFLKLNLTYNNFLSSIYFQQFCSIVEKFIIFFKTNHFDYQYIQSINYSTLEKEMLNIIFNIYKQYIEEKNSTGKLDFDDLIVYATKLTNKINLNYKYIIIDEFQDTSLIRLNLIKQIYLSENAKIIVVGDDWQSIYNFSGCDLNIFLNFSNYFHNVNNIQLQYTYRNSQELIDIASLFIQKNPNQIKKNLISQKHNLNPITLVPYTKPSYSLKKILNHLFKITNDILIISRNNNDIYQYIDKDITFKNNTIIFQNHIVQYLTVHKSKGLEAEYTIILNCNNDILGFPNKLENAKIIDKLIKKEQIPYAEERRLFYVALTRCKEKTFILYNKKNPSKFITELKRIIKKTLGYVPYFK